jgi:hypothetical protein
MKTVTKLWIGIVMLALLSPLGVILPEHFKAGPAWGEWSGEEIEKIIGYLPKGLEKLSGVWTAPLPEYAIKEWNGRGMLDPRLSSVLSAAVGIGITVLIVIGIGKLLSKDDK